MTVRRLRVAELSWACFHDRGSPVVLKRGGPEASSHAPRAGRSDGVDTFGLGALDGQALNGEY